MIAFPLAVSLLTIYTALRLIYSSFALQMMNNFLRKSWQRKRDFAKLKHILFNKNKTSDFAQRENKRSKEIANLAGGMVLLPILLAYFESEGKKAALEIYDKLGEKPPPAHEVMTVTINGVSKELFYVFCGAKNCAGVDLDTQRIEYFPQLGHSHALRPEKSTEMKAMATE